MAKTRKREDSASPVMPARIFAQVSPRSIGGVSLFDAMGAVHAGTVANFRSEPRIIDAAVNRLRAAGFDVLQVTAWTINIAGSQETYEKAFRTRIEIERRTVIKPGGVEALAEFIECPDTPMPGLIAVAGTPFEEVIEGVAIEEPRYFMAAAAFPPPVPYWHLAVPADVALGLNAEKVHRSGISGGGIRVAMVDSGQYAHPFFAARGYRVAPVVLGPAAADPERDAVGHGTGESANIFAVAPDAELLPVKVNFVNSVGAFNAAAALDPQIITCSWGSSNRNGPLSAADQALAAAVAAAWAAGIVVIFSAGNGHYGFPAQHPDCIAAGGVCMAQDGSLRASDYASGFMSGIYPGRRVPDACGLVGMQPKAIYIMLPINPGCQIDSAYGGGAFPSGDQTGGDDGWGCFSGTSAAAPQLAGVAALVRQACPRLSPDEVRDILRKSARDVTLGNCNPASGGHPATAGPDLATGDGLVDAHKAVLLAKLRCLAPGPMVRREPGLGRNPPGAGAGQPVPLSTADIASIETLVIESELDR
jgi:subtilisin family serine protease